MKKKLAIISNYNELCGNANYTHVLFKQFSLHCQTEILRLNTKLLTADYVQFNKLAARHIDQLSQRIKEFDYVNIQFEAGLYGNFPFEIFKRFKKLINNDKRIIVTLHRLDLKKKILTRELLNLIVKFKFFEILRYIKQNKFASLYDKIIKLIKKNPNISILVHTKREKYLIESIYNLNRVYDHPISFLNKEMLNNLVDDRTQYKKILSLPLDKKIIGTFGFISEYKNIPTIVESLKFLPKNYVLYIFGGVHPNTISKYDKYANKEIESLIEIINKDIKYKNRDNFYNLKNRVFFYGQVDDEDFVKGLKAVDFNIIAYRETNQSGSGICSLSLETKSNLIISNTYTSIELEKYAPGCFPKFDIGNAIQLANLIKYYKRDKYKKNLINYNLNYNIEKLIQLKIKIFEGIEY